MKYPFLAQTNAAKYAFVKRGFELLRKEHNIMGDWYDPDLDLIPLVGYQGLRAFVQIAFPYDGKKLSEENWKKYLDGRFETKMKVLLTEEGRLKNLLYKSTRFSLNLDDDIK